MSTYPRSDQPRLFVTREDVQGVCPCCGSQNLKRYPVLTEGGWWMVTKCQDCLCSLQRERWSRLGSIGLLTDLL
jgi:vanillate/4-hydroxybenzoate decarboxylase subunit D